jgi:hypothetical protein
MPSASTRCPIASVTTTSTLVTDHAIGRVVGADEGKDTATLTGFVEELGDARAAQLGAVSLDMGQAYPKVVRERAPRPSCAGTPSTSWPWPAAPSTPSPRPLEPPAGHHRRRHRPAVQRPAGPCCAAPTT